MPTVTAMANARMKYAAGVMPRVSNPGVTIDLATNAAIGCMAQVLTKPRASNAESHRHAGHGRLRRPPPHRSDRLGERQDLGALFVFAGEQRPTRERTQQWRDYQHDQRDDGRDPAVAVHHGIEPGARAERRDVAAILHTGFLQCPDDVQPQENQTKCHHTDQRQTDQHLESLLSPGNPESRGYLDRGRGGRGGNRAAAASRPRSCHCSHFPRAHFRLAEFGRHADPSARK